jgi:hypothetical protein
MYQKSILLLLLILLSLSGCGYATKVEKNKIPDWMTNSNFGDKISAVGCSTKHIDGVSGQKALAVQRAIKLIAMQNEVTVSSVTLNKRSKSSSSTQSTSVHEIKNVKVSTIVKDYYTKDDGDICAWVVQQ